MRDGAERVRAARRRPPRVGLAARQPARRRLLVPEDGRAARYLPTESNHARLLRRRRLARAAGHRRRGVRPPDVAGVRRDGLRPRPADRPAARSLAAPTQTALPADYALLTGSSSMYTSLRCAVVLAEYLAEPQPDWELAADQLAPRGAPAPGGVRATSAGSRWTGTTRSSAARCAGRPRPTGCDGGWDNFVVDGLGIRCVNDEPWVTGGGDLRAGDRAGPDRRPGPGADLVEEMQHPAPRGRRLLDRLAVREQASTGRTSRAPRPPPRDPRRRHHVRGHGCVVVVPDGCRRSIRRVVFW